MNIFRRYGCQKIASFLFRLLSLTAVIFGTVLITEGSNVVSVTYPSLKSNLNFDIAKWPTLGETYWSIYVQYFCLALSSLLCLNSFLLFIFNFGWIPDARLHKQIKMCLAGFIFGLFLSVMQMWYCSLEWYFIHERNHYSYFVHEWAHASLLFFFFATFQGIDAILLVTEHKNIDETNESEIKKSLSSVPILNQQDDRKTSNVSTLKRTSN